MDIYIYCIDSQANDLDLNTLSKTEINRYLNFFFIDDQINYAANQIIKRSVLEKKLGVLAKNIKYVTDKNGKKKVSSFYDFSASRSKGASVFGVSKNRIGVDIEKIIDTNNRYMPLKNAFLCDAETGFINNDRELIINWTIKEAFLKYIGKGLYVEPSSFGFKILNQSKIEFYKGINNFSLECLDYLVFVINRKYCISICFPKKEKKIRIFLLNKNREISIICNTSATNLEILNKSFSFIFNKQ
ncbi:4'-phosphopantetheinyl transferase family protein [Polaribacter sp.]|uniref:4'-phosphopantetheinyl transferase family protein n=1 Tax=Polaribacter sp. TaxID=1920175 RepID=UPI003EF2ABDD